MLIVFQSKAWANVTMFGDVATTLLKMMGHSGTVPGAILPADIPAALIRLQREVDAAAKTQRPVMETAAAAADADKAAGPVGIAQRAYPLIELLKASAAQGSEVLWRESRPNAGTY